LGQFSIQYSHTQIAENSDKNNDSKNRDSCKNMFKNLNIFTFITIYILITIILSLLRGSNILQIRISMAEIPDMALLFIKQYQIRLYIKEVLIIWEPSFFFFLPTYIKDISYNVMEFKCLLKIFLILNSYMFEEYFLYNNIQYILFITYILLYYLTEQYSRYNFTVQIKHVLYFVLFSF
jgi:hypothetical protein